jgi:murein DD-endopeptidase MepM/ murein hydrolase activator NlpD
MKFPILEMNRIRALLKKACVSVTILVIPHDHVRTLNVRVPGALLVLSLLLAVIGGGYVVSLAVSGLQYRAQHNAMAARVRFYSDQFYQWSSTVTSLRTVEQEFRNLFSLGSKEAVLEQADTSFKGSLEIPELVEELQHTLESVDEIKNYLRIQKDIFVATPRGYPVQGRITSSYGKRKDPLTGDDAFHSGIDISSGPGTPIRATADGVVSHSGWTRTSGYVVVVEHGCGFSTIFAHNKKNAVQVGQQVSKGDVIGYVGSTGRATGPHLHYEIWKDGRNINPQPYLAVRM